MKRLIEANRKRRAGILRLLLPCAALAVAPAGNVGAGTPAHGTVYIGAAFGTHNVYKVDFDYDGVGSMSATATILATLPTAADALIVPGGGRQRSSRRCRPPPMR